MSRVSVSAGQKPKPKEGFRFLRRDEGRLSYSAIAAESPSKSTTDDNDGPRTHRERRDSKSLRDAIAYDMRNAKSHDPLGEVVVAVPRKAPPPNRAASVPAVSRPSSNGVERSAAGMAPPRRAPVRAASTAKPEWVNPDTFQSDSLRPPPASNRPELSLEQDSHVDPSYTDPYSTGNSATQADGGPRSTSRSTGGNGGDRGRYGGLTPRGTGIGAPRYVSAEYDGSIAAASAETDRNYFRRPPYSRDSESPALVASNRDEDELIARLEQEIKAAQEERAHFAYARQQLDRDRQRFEGYRSNTQQQIEDDRAGTDERRVREQRETQKDLRAAEDRCRNVSAVLATEREANRRLVQENDSLRAQLEDLTSTMRETQDVHKAEVARMRRDIDSLTRRNAELLAMTKEQQLRSLEGASSQPVKQLVNAPRHSVSRDRPVERMSSPMIGSPASDSDGAPAVSSVKAARVAAPSTADSPPRRASREKRKVPTLDITHGQEEYTQDRKQHRESWSAEHEGEEHTKELNHRAACATKAPRQREDDAELKSKATTAAWVAPVTEKPVDERRASGHPTNTPRMQLGTTVVKRRLSTGTPRPPVPPKRRHVPSRAELMGDVEAAPAEDFPNDAIVSQTALGDNPNKKEVLYRSGKREIHYANGTVKIVLPSGHTMLHFTNKDMKSTFPSGKSTYWYDAAQTMHSQMPDGVQTFEFRATGQTEKHLPDGSKEILYPDGIYKIVKVDGTEETFCPTGELMED